MRQSKETRESIAQFLFFLGCIFVLSSILWTGVDLWRGTIDRWTWFSRMVAGGVLLGLSALIDKEDK